MKKAIHPTAFDTVLNVAWILMNSCIWKGANSLIYSHNKAGGKVGYTATDSVYTDLPLHTMPEFTDVIGNDLGQLV